MTIVIKGGGTTLTLPTLPEKINVKMNNVERTYNIIQIGTIVFPHGNEPTEISWDGTLFGEDRADFSALVSSPWLEPNEIVSILEDWKKKGDELQLIVSDSFINYTVELKKFEPTPVGGHGDIEYSILFREHGTVMITKKSKSKKKKGNKKKTKPRKNKVKAKTETKTVNAAGGLHLRSGANGEILSTMPNGAKVTTDGKKDGNWVHVCINNVWGYAYEGYLK